MVKLAEIADAAGCSVATVSRVLSRNPDAYARTGNELRAKIILTADKLGYRPNRSAEFLKRGKNPVIGVFLPDYRNQLIAEIIVGISSAAEKYAFSLSFSFDNTVESYKRFIELTHGGKNCGLITYPLFMLDKEAYELIERYCAEGGKMVLLNSGNACPDMRSCVSRIEIDDYEGGRLVAQTLAGHNCSRYVIISGIARRRAGFMDFFAGSGVLPEVFEEDDGALEQLVEICAAAKEKIGILAGTDRTAIRLHSAFLRRGIIPGEQIKLIGYDDMSLVANLSPALTSVHQPFVEAGAAALEQLVSDIYGGETKMSKLNPYLIRRETA